MHGAQELCDGISDIKVRQGLKMEPPYTPGAVYGRVLCVVQIQSTVQGLHAPG